MTGWTGWLVETGGAGGWELLKDESQAEAENVRGVDWG